MSTTIIYNQATIGDAYAPSLNAAFAQIFAESGIMPRVLLPYGGERTPAQQQVINPGQTNSDHVKKRAVDIDNQVELRFWNQSRFLNIMAAHGWNNVQVDGQPFAHEPWHFANQSSTPAGGDVTPIDNTTPKDKDMSTVTIMKQSTLAAGGSRVKGQTVFVVTDFALRSPSNWQETVCAYVDGGPGDVLAQFTAALGGRPSAVLSDADWNTWRATLSGTVTP